MLGDLFLSVHFWTALAALCLVYLGRQNKTNFPLVNGHLFDFLGSKTSRELHQNAFKMIKEGFAKHQGPITFNITNGQKIMLPASLAGWVQSNKDLDHRDLVKEDFMAGIPGFEAQAVLHMRDEKLIGVIKTKLGQNDSTITTMNASVERALEALWSDSREWHSIDWHNDTMGVIARAASSVFVGPEKSEDAEWLGLVQDYVLSYFTGVSKLQKYPVISRSIVHWFMPEAIKCRKHVARARVIMNEVLRERREKSQITQHNMVSSTYNDALEWTQNVPGLKVEAGDIQLSLAMAALFTTSELFRQILIDIASHPELTEPLRDEVSEQFSAHGVSISATTNMTLLDSVMKESQRQSSGFVLERKALKDVLLPDGRVIPGGSHIMVDSTNLWDPNEYPDPDRFDGYRFLRKREAGDKSCQFVQSSADFHVFGGGRHICPGRFFASSELKLVLANILLKYDIRIIDGSSSKPMQMGFYKMVDPAVRFEVRRRNEGHKLDRLT